MELPSKDNKNVVQSYIITAARYDFSVYEKRILYRLVELAQVELQGKKLKDVVGWSLETNELGDKEITIPLASVLAHDEDKNYEAAKKAFRAFNKRTIEEHYNNGNGLLITNLIERVDINVGTGLASFRVAPNIWKSILNFTEGYRKFELKTTLEFRSTYSMRFYELMSGQKAPLTYKVEDLRAMFGLKSKLKNTPDFERYVLDVAKAELDEHSPYSFTYERNEVRSRGRNGKKVVSYTFIPRFIHKNKDQDIERKELVAQIPITSLIPGDVYEYLLNKGLTKEQLSANKDTIHEFCKASPDVLGQIAIAWGRARGAQNQIGYFINTIKGMTKDAQKKT